MAFGRTREIVMPEPPQQAPPSLIASAMKLSFDNVGNNNWRFRDQTWQREMWRLYDIIPEFRAAAGWVGSCCSRVRIYVAEVDKLGRIQGEATDPAVSALADSVFGSPAAKAEALRIGGINLTVAGEYYVLGQAAADDSEDDKWYVLSSMEVRRVKGGDVYWGDPMGQQILDSARQMITRVWTPHPSRIMWADCPAKACQPVLRELEQLTKYTFSQIDSRLAGAGLFIIPNDIDFPAEDGVSTASESLMIRLAEAMSSSLKGEGQATALVPLILEAPTDSIDKGFKYITFATELSKQAMELKSEAVKRLGMGMDMPPEVMSGMGKSNHWCVSSDTEALSKDRGWVQGADLRLDELILTLNHATGQSQWQQVEHVYQAAVIDEQMLSMTSQSHSSLSTGNHRWPIIKTEEFVGTPRQWTTTTEGFAAGDRVPVTTLQAASNEVTEYFNPGDCQQEWVPYTGTVWCPTTANGTWLARSPEGHVFFTGNSSVQIEEQGTKVHIEPLMIRQCAALTDTYLRPALKVMGKDPRRFVYWFDTAPLTARPQRLTDAVNLYDKGILSEAAVRAEGDFAEADAPDANERAERFMREVILRDPQLFSMQGPRELAGITEQMLPQEAIAPTAVGQGQGGLPGPSGPPPPPPPPTGIQSELPGPTPNNGQVPAGPPGPAGQPAGLTASADTLRSQMSTMALVVAAEATVRRALELAGGRLLDRHNRDRWPDVPRHELHTRIRVTDAAHATRLMHGSWDHLGELAALLNTDIDVEQFQAILTQYCSLLLTMSTAHEPRLLVSMLRSEGLIHG